MDVFKDGNALYSQKFCNKKPWISQSPWFLTRKNFESQKFCYKFIEMSSSPRFQRKNVLNFKSTAENCGSLVMTVLLYRDRFSFSITCLNRHVYCRYSHYRERQFAILLQRVCSRWYYGDNIPFALPGPISSVLVIVYNTATAKSLHFTPRSTTSLISATTSTAPSLNVFRGNEAHLNFEQTLFENHHHYIATISLHSTHS